MDKYKALNLLSSCSTYTFNNAVAILVIKNDQVINGLGIKLLLLNDQMRYLSAPCMHFYYFLLLTLIKVGSVDHLS